MKWSIQYSGVIFQYLASGPIGLRGGEGNGEARRGGAGIGTNANLLQLLRPCVVCGPCSATKRFLLDDDYVSKD